MKSIWLPSGGSKQSQSSLGIFVAPISQPTPHTLPEGMSEDGINFNEAFQNVPEEMARNACWAPDKATPEILSQDTPF